MGVFLSSVLSQASSSTSDTSPITAAPGWTSAIVRISSLNVFCPSS